MRRQQREPTAPVGQEERIVGCDSVFPLHVQRNGMPMQKIRGVECALSLNQIGKRDGVAVNDERGRAVQQHLRG
jgi:hypothetical protein